MFRDHENKKEFQEVIKMIELMSKPSLCDNDEEIIIAFLKQQQGLNGKFEHLNKFLRKRVSH